MGSHIVFQVINHDQKETFFGVTDRHLDKTIEAIAKDPKGPARGWKKGDTVEWRPLTEPMELEGAELVHRELETSGKRDYATIPTLKDPS